MQADMVNVSVAGMLRLLCAHQQTGCLQVKGEDGEGQIYIEQGRLVGTADGAKKLPEEVLRLLLVRRGSFNFAPSQTVPDKYRQGDIADVENLILEASRRGDPQVLTEQLPPADAVMQLAPFTTDREILHLDLRREEWNFLTKVNMEETLQVLLEGSDLPRERAVQVAYGLLAAGLMRKLRFRMPEVTDIARRELGNMGEALVRQAFHKLKIDPGRIRMQGLIALLNELEGSITLLLGPTRANKIVGHMWEGVKK